MFNYQVPMPSQPLQWLCLMPCYCLSSETNKHCSKAHTSLINTGFVEGLWLFAVRAQTKSGKGLTIWMTWGLGQKLEARSWAATAWTIEVVSAIPGDEISMIDECCSWGMVSLGLLQNPLMSRWWIPCAPQEFVYLPALGYEFSPYCRLAVFRGLSFPLGKEEIRESSKLFASPWYLVTCVSFIFFWEKHRPPGKEIPKGFLLHRAAVICEPSVLSPKVTTWHSTAC